MSMLSRRRKLKSPPFCTVTIYGLPFLSSPAALSVSKMPLEFVVPLAISWFLSLRILTFAPEIGSSVAKELAHTRNPSLPFFAAMPMSVMRTHFCTPWYWPCGRMPTW